MNLNGITNIASIHRIPITHSMLALQIRMSASNGGRQKAEQRIRVPALILQAIGEDPVAVGDPKKGLRCHDCGHIDQDIACIAGSSSEANHIQVMTMHLMAPWKPNASCP